MFDVVTGSGVTERPVESKTNYDPFSRLTGTRDPWAELQSASLNQHLIPHLRRTGRRKLLASKTHHRVYLSGRSISGHEMFIPCLV